MRCIRRMLVTLGTAALLGCGPHVAQQPANTIYPAGSILNRRDSGWIFPRDSILRRGGNDWIFPAGSILNHNP
jgi:hypothetical protein